jgi:PAS domain S-box-containing protein
MLPALLTDMSEARRPRMRGPREADEDPSADICRLLIERVREYAIFTLDLNGRVTSWNEGAERIKGYTGEEIIGRSMSSFYREEDKLAGLPESLLAIAREEGRVENEGWRVRKDGTRFWADVVITAIHSDDGTLLGYGKVTRDLTARKQAEQELGELSGRLLQLQDEERRQIAGELHDTTSPLLTRLLARLYALRQRPDMQSADLAKSVDETLALAEATGKMVRTVFGLLHPPVLDDAGLLAGLRWFLETFTGRTGMQVDAQLPDLMPRPPHEQEVALFRLTQEWLNRMQRAGVGAAAVRMTMTKDKLELRISNRSRRSGETGEPMIDPAIYLANRERIRLLGGRLDLEMDGGGVIAILPVRGSTRTSNVIT